MYVVTRQKLFNTNDNQFGYKGKRGPDMCVRQARSQKFATGELIWGSGSEASSHRRHGG